MRSGSTSTPQAAEQPQLAQSSVSTRVELTASGANIYNDGQLVDQVTDDGAGSQTHYFPTIGRRTTVHTGYHLSRDVVARNCPASVQTALQGADLAYYAALGAMIGAIGASAALDIVTLGAAALAGLATISTVTAFFAAEVNLKAAQQAAVEAGC